MALILKQISEYVTTRLANRMFNSVACCLTTITFVKIYLYNVTLINPLLRLMVSIEMYLILQMILLSYYNLIKNVHGNINDNEHITW